MNQILKLNSGSDSSI